MEHSYLIGSYDDDDILVSAVKRIRSEGYQMHEIFTPFPVHGLDPAMGLQDSRLHTAGFIFGGIGALFAVGSMGYISAVDWPNMFGGKPFFSLPAFVPITFELTVLFASVGMVIVYYLRNGLSAIKDQEIVDPRATDDRFVMAFCMKQYHTQEDRDAISALLKETGAVEIRVQDLENELEPNLLTSDHDAHLADAHHH